MAGWFRRESEAKIPEKYRGLTEEQIVALLEKGETVDGLNTKVTELSTAKTNLEKKVSEGDSALQTMRQQIQALEKNQRPPEKREEPAGVSFIEDPEGFIRQEIGKFVAPVGVATLNASAQLARSGAKQTLDRLRVSGTKISKGAVWDKYSSEIEDLAKTVNVGQLQTADAWIHLFNMVLGRHLDEILTAFQGGKGEEMFVEPSASGVARVENNDPPKPTDDEVRIAKRMGIKVEDYIKQKGTLTFA